jgi:hypothetical protein
LIKACLDFRDKSRMKKAAQRRADMSTCNRFPQQTGGDLFCDGIDLIGLTACRFGLVDGLDESGVDT